MTDRQSIEVVARQFKIDTIYNLAALLSVVAESRPAMAWKIGIDGLWNAGVVVSTVAARNLPPYARWPLALLALPACILNVVSPPAWSF